MKNIIYRLLTFGLVCLVGACSPKTDFTVTSPDGQITAMIKFENEQGTINYREKSRNQEIISSSPIGISTRRSEFESGMKLIGYSKRMIDVRYQLPQGKGAVFR